MIACYLIVLCKIQQQPTLSVGDVFMSQVFMNFLLEFHSRQQRDASDRVFLPLTSPTIASSDAASWKVCCMWIQPCSADALAVLLVLTLNRIS